MIGRGFQDAVGAEFGQIAVAAHGLDDAAHAIRRFQQDDGHAALLETKGGGQPGDAAADDGNWLHIVLEKRRSLAAGQIAIKAHGDVADEQAAHLVDHQAIRPRVATGRPFPGPPANPVRPQNSRQSLCPGPWKARRSPGSGRTSSRMIVWRRILSSLLKM